MKAPKKYLQNIELRERLDPGQEIPDERYSTLLAKAYNAHQHCKSRCHNPNDKRFVKYGERGITVAPRWRNKDTGFINFITDMGLPPGDGLNWSIERLNVDIGYRPDNCCWLDMKGQANNRTNTTRLNFMGEEKSLTEWSEIVGISPKVVSRRINRGMSVADALLTPYISNEATP
jgi:hypothetical protein